MRILFIYPSWTGEMGILAHFSKRAGIYPPLNLALLAAIAEKSGHEAHIIDAEADCLHPKDVIKRAKKINPDIIGMTGKSPFFHLSKDMAELIKKEMPYVKVIIGGNHITIKEKEVFHDCFDYGFVGECDLTFGDFLTRVENGEDLKPIKGLLYRENGEVIYTGKCDYITDLDLLPWPNRRLLPYKKYKLGSMQEGRKNFTSIQTIRGCPWKCIFCASEKLATTNVRKRSAKSVIAEIHHIVEDLNVRHIMIVDDVMTLNKPHIEEICQAIIDSRLNITFEGGTRANLMIDEELVKLMRRAGLIRVGFGLETVDSELRKTMGKKVPLHYYTEANKLLAKYGIEAQNSVMLGLPGETPKTIMKTLNFLRNDRNIKQANFAIAVPYPGTAFYEIARKGEQGMKLMSEDFSEYKRYGTAVTNVNGMTQQDLIDFQNEGFVSIYSAPWRWKAVFRKHGIFGGILFLMRVFKLMYKMTQGKTLSSFKVNN